MGLSVESVSIPQRLGDRYGNALHLTYSSGGIMDLWAAVWSFAGQFGVTVAVTIAAAWGLFRYLGDKWLTTKFNSSLESFKHAQQQEIERLRLRINTVFDRTVKLHTQEFDVLPELWERLIDAYGHIMTFISPMQSYPNLDRLNPAELDHFLSQSKLHDYQKDDLRNASNKLEKYMDMIFWHSYNEVNGRRSHFENYNQSKGLFIQNDIQVKIRELADLMWSALTEARLEKEYPNLRAGRFEKGEKFRAEGPQLREEIGQAIKEKLWDTKGI
ncbi:hypothetical protein BH10PLA2_BH10PLA2_00200 [soil metagenome]